jgi:hypothetical protein
MRTKTLGVLAALALFSGSSLATQGVSMTSTSTRTPITSNLYSTQWGQSPLFNFVLQTSNSTWGYDLVHATNTWAVAAADGTPSQSGWHSHPVPIGFVQVISGGVWIQEHANPGCVTYFPAGSMFIEGTGHIHNAYNFDKKTPAVTLATWYLERYLPSTRVDQPDPITNDPNIASPPPAALCPGSPIPPAQ